MSIGLITLDFNLAGKLQAAIALVEKRSPSAKEMVDKRIRNIIPVYHLMKAGLDIFHYEDYPVIGDYYIPVERIEKLSEEEIATRIFAVAILLEMEEEVAEPNVWRLRDEEIEKNASKYIEAFREVRGQI